MSRSDAAHGLETSLTSAAQFWLFSAHGLETSLASAATTLFAAHGLDAILASDAQCGYPYLKG